MQISVLVEPLGSHGYRASSAPFNFSCDGATSTEAVLNLRSKIEQHLTAGAELVTLDIAENANPWIQFGGMFKDDPIFAEVVKSWLKIVAVRTRIRTFMKRYLMDTDILSLFQWGHPKVLARCSACKPDQLFVAIISVEEQVQGWLARIRKAKDNSSRAHVYDRFTRAIIFLKRLPILSFSEPAQSRFDDLLTQRLNIGKMDLRIAAIGLEASYVVVTRNARDFGRVPGLVFEDWSL